MTIDSKLALAGVVLTGLGMFAGMWVFSLNVVRSINGKFTNVALTLARIDERVKGVEADVARHDGTLNQLAQREE